MIWCMKWTMCVKVWHDIWNDDMIYDKNFYSTSTKFVVFWLADGHWMKFPYPMARFFNVLFCLKLPFDRIKNTYPTTSHGIWDLSHTSVSYIPLSFASWDIITSVWNKSPYPMVGCWISYNVMTCNKKNVCEMIMWYMKWWYMIKNVCEMMIWCMKW